MYKAVETIVIFGVSPNGRVGAADAVAGIFLSVRSNSSEDGLPIVRPRGVTVARGSARACYRAEWLRLRDMGDQEVVPCVGKFGCPILVERRLGFCCRSDATGRESSLPHEP